MKKWKEYNTSERGMIVVAIVLLVAVLLSWGRISKGTQRGFGWFFQSETIDTVVAPEK